MPSAETEATHTPGPWSRTSFGEILDGHGYIIVNIRAYGVSRKWQNANPGRSWTTVNESHRKLSDAECLANARLIASAPDMLAALAHIEAVAAQPGDFMQPKARMESILEAARAALAKAKGEAL